MCSLSPSPNFTPALHFASALLFLLAFMPSRDQLYEEHLALFVGQILPIYMSPLESQNHTLESLSSSINLLPCRSATFSEYLSAFVTLNKVLYKI